MLINIKSATTHVALLFLVFVRVAVCGPQQAAPTTTIMTSLTESASTWKHSLSQHAMAALDSLTTQSITYISGSSSVFIPLPKNQSLHIMDFPGTGTLPPMVLLHGISSCASDYYPLVRFLQQHCSRVIALDLPGHGYTKANIEQSLTELEGLMVLALETCLKKLKVGKCHLLGNSLGGFVACKFASRHASKLHSLVLVSPAGAPLSDKELEEMKKLFTMTTLGDSMAFLERVLGKQKGLPFGLRHIAGWACLVRSRRPSVKRILQEATIQNRITNKDLAAISCPVLLMWGQEEAVFDENKLAYFRTHLRQDKLRVSRPKGMGHVPHLDVYSVTKEIVDFIASSAPSSQR